MKPLKVSEAEVGMRVKLTNPDIDYKIGGENPAVGSRYECVGEITEVRETIIKVQWENNNYNYYKRGELSLCEDEGMCVDLWRA